MPEDFFSESQQSPEVLGALLLVAVGLIGGAALIYGWCYLVGILVESVPAFLRGKGFKAPSTDSMLPGIFTLVLPIGFMLGVVGNGFDLVQGVTVALGFAVAVFVPLIMIALLAVGIGLCVSGASALVLGRELSGQARVAVGVYPALVIVGLLFAYRADAIRWIDGLLGM